LSRGGDKCAAERLRVDSEYGFDIYYNAGALTAVGEAKVRAGGRDVEISRGRGSCCADGRTGSPAGSCRCSTPSSQSLRQCKGRGSSRCGLSRAEGSWCRWMRFRSPIPRRVSSTSSVLLSSLLTRPPLRETRRGQVDDAPFGPRLATGPHVEKSRGLEEVDAGARSLPGGGRGVPRSRRVAASRLKISAEEGGLLARCGLRRSWHPCPSLNRGGRGEVVLLCGVLRVLALVAKSKCCIEEVQRRLIGRRLGAIWR